MKFIYLTEKRKEGKKLLFGTFFGISFSIVVMDILELFGKIKAD